MEEKEKKKRGRKKNDIVLKYYMSKLIKGLSGEEVKYMMLALIIEQDEKELRYENDNETLKEIFRNEDKEIIKEFNKMLLKNPTLQNNYSIMSGQVNNSKKSFLSWQNQPQKPNDNTGSINKSDQENTQTPEEDTNNQEKNQPEQEYEMEITAEDANGEEFRYTVRLANSNCNFPSEKELKDVIMYFGLTKEYLKEVFDKAQQDKWAVFWTTYFKEDIEEALGIREEF